MARRKMKVVQEKVDTTSSPRHRKFRLLRRNLRKEGFAWEPVAILPPELATMCLQYALPSSSSGDYPLRLLDLTAVSRRWESFLFSTPSFWTTIHVKYTAHDLMATIALFAHLSGQGAIKLVVCNDLGREWDTVKSLLQPHMHRIYSVALGNETPIYSESPFRDAGYISLVKNIVNSLGHPLSLVEVDFGRRLVLKPSQIMELDLPANVRVKSSILGSLEDAPSWGLFLTPSTHTGVQTKPGANALSNLVRKKALEPAATNDLTISHLNSNIKSLIEVLNVIDTPSITGLVHSSFEPFISRDMCLLCGKRKYSPARALGCVRSHLGLCPFRCNGCGSCNAANGYASFSTLYQLHDHIRPTCTTCGTQTTSARGKSDGENICVACLSKSEGRGRERVSIAQLCNP